MNWSDWFPANTLYLYPLASRLVVSIFVLLLGFWVASIVTRWMRRLMVRLFSRKALAESPLGEVIRPAETLRGSGVFSSVVYAFVLFLFVAIAGEMLGITFFSQVVSLVLGFVPNLAAALVVLILGFLLAGVVERVVKQQFRRYFPNQALLAGTISSSVTLSLFLLMALAELGIAQEFILILFGGFVLAFALSIGLALGLGARPMVEEMFDEFVKREIERRKNSQ